MCRSKILAKLRGRANSTERSESTEVSSNKEKWKIHRHQVVADPEDQSQCLPGLEPRNIHGLLMPMPKQRKRVMVEQKTRSLSRKARAKNTLNDE